MPKLSLKYFILSQQSLALYRQFIKTISKIPDVQIKNETYEQVRTEFDKYRHIDNTSQMEYLIATGRKQYAMLVSLTGGCQ